MSISLKGIVVGFVGAGMLIGSSSVSALDSNDGRDLLDFDCTLKAVGISSEDVLGHENIGCGEGYRVFFRVPSGERYGKYVPKISCDVYSEMIRE